MTTKKYQNKVVKTLRDIFGNELVRKEWDIATYDGHFDKHKLFYAPRVDVAVGPFNSSADLDIGNDKTRQMKSHPFIRRLKKGIGVDIVWNEFSRCFLAIEMEFSGSLKHILGSIVNASMTGSIAILIGDKENIKKIKRVSNYLKGLAGMDKITGEYFLANYVIFEKNQFLKFLISFKGRK